MHAVVSGSPPMSPLTLVTSVTGTDCLICRYLLWIFFTYSTGIIHCWGPHTAPGINDTSTPAPITLIVTTGRSTSNIFKRHKAWNVYLLISEFQRHGSLSITTLHSFSNPPQTDAVVKTLSCDIVAVEWPSTCSLLLWSLLSGVKDVAILHPLTDPKLPCFFDSAKPHWRHTLSTQWTIEACFDTWQRITFHWASFETVTPLLDQPWANIKQLIEKLPSWTWTSCRVEITHYCNEV